jgi:hypothetical protein
MMYSNQWFSSYIDRYCNKLLSWETMVKPYSGVVDAIVDEIWSGKQTMSKARLAYVPKPSAQSAHPNNPFCLYHHAKFF